MDYTAEMKMYLADKCKDIPETHFSNILNELLKEAAYVMETQIPGDIKEFARQLKWLIETRYPYIPLSKLIEAFHKGSLGEIGGTMKLSIRNINIWVKDINQEWNNGDIARRNRDRMDSTDIDKSEVADPDSAKAYSLRIKWGTSKRITHEQWDYLSSQHEQMVAKIREMKGVDDFTPGMFLSGFVEPSHIEDSEISKVF